MNAYISRDAQLVQDADHETAVTHVESEQVQLGQKHIPLRVTVFESSTDKLSKAYEWRDGELRKEVAPQLYKGTAVSVEIASARDLATLLDTLPGKKALALCNIARTRSSIATEAKADPLNGTIARTKTNFGWDPSALALMLFDVDVQGYMPQQVLEIVRKLDLAFSTAAAVGRYSTSSFIDGPNGFATERKGVHLFVPVAHPDRMEEVGKILAKRLWLAGYGHIALARNGRLLVRQLIDAFVWSPERLVYEASPKLGAELTQRRPPTEVFEGSAVELAAVTALTDEEAAEYQRLVDEAKAAALPEAERVFEGYLQTNAHELGTTVEDLRERWQALKPDSKGETDAVLPPDFLLDLGKLGRMSVRNLVATLDGGGHTPGNFPDPVEGAAYGRSCAYVQPEKTHLGSWRIYSLAHGGMGYILGREPMSIADDRQDVMLEAHEGAKSASFKWGDAEPIPDSLPPVEPFDANAMLPGTLAPWVEDVAERMQCPVDYLGVAAMVICGSLIGARIGVRPKRVDTWYEVPNLWGLIVGRSGDKKTPALSEMLAGLRKLQEAARQDQEKALGLHALALMQHEQDLARKKMQAKKGGYMLTPMDLQAPSAPQEKRHIVNDTTVEALGVILQHNPNGLLCYADELAGFLARLDGEERRSDRAFYLEAYNGKHSFSVDRITREPVRIPRLCVSILGTSQPDALRQYLRHAVLGGFGNDGLVQRFQLAVYPDRDRGPVKVIDHAPDGIVLAQAMQTFADLDRLDPSTVGAQDGCSIPTVGFDQQAQPEVDRWLLQIETVLRNSDEHPALISHYSKFRKTIPTLALIIHLAEYGRGPISIAAFRKALAWMPYLQSHALRIYASVTAGQMDSARALAKRIERGALNDGFTIREIVRCNWAGLAAYEEVRQAVELLIDLGWLRQTDEKTGGRPSARYWIHPHKQKKAA